MSYEGRFIEETPGKGEMYRISTEVLILLRSYKLDVSQAGAVLACCIDQVMLMLPADQRPEFTAKTVKLLVDLSKEPA